MLCKKWGCHWNDFKNNKRNENGNKRRIYVWASREIRVFLRGSDCIVNYRMWWKIKKIKNTEGKIKERIMQRWMQYIK